MKYLKIILLKLLFFIPISSSFGAVTFVDSQVFEDGSSTIINGIAFNDDGTKMFTSYQFGTGTDNHDFVNEYTLSVPYDISTHTYTGDAERCFLDDGGDIATKHSGGNKAHPQNIGDLTFSSDGLKLFVVNRGTNGNDNDIVLRFDLSVPYDVSTCSYVHFVNPDTDALQHGNKKIGDRSLNKRKHVQGVEINPEGTKIFLSFNDNRQPNTTSIMEYHLSTPYDLETMELYLNGGILLNNGNTNPDAIFFGANGYRIFVAYHMSGTSGKVEQYSLSSPYDTTSFTLDGEANINDLVPSATLVQVRALAFNSNGLKMYVSNDGTAATGHTDETIYEFDLKCPFTIIPDKCPAITTSTDRTGIAEAQIELANRTILLSSNSALNRLKWIRRNKDKQNLSNHNIKYNFSNEMLSSLKDIPLSSIKKISATKKDNYSKSNYFYWSEGSVLLGKVDDTSLSAAKDISSNSITFGFDKFSEKLGIRGFAFRLGNEDVDVGSRGSNLDAKTYNLTYYSTSPIKNDTKLVDTIIGIGKIKLNTLTVLDNNNLSANRTGQQIYFTHKIKDEIKYEKLTIIPSGQIDFGHTILNKYSETGSEGATFSDQHVRTRNLRGALAFVEDLSNEKITYKRHGKLEYLADLYRSSNLNYKYNTGGSSVHTTLHTGATHNLNGEIGLDIIFPENYSIFIIYERNQALSGGLLSGSGYNDNLYIAVGYLPHKDTEYAFTLNGSENLMSKLEVKKDIKGFDLIFNLNDDLTNIGDAREAYIELNKVF